MHDAVSGMVIVRGAGTAPLIPRFGDVGCEEDYIIGTWGCGPAAPSPWRLVGLSLLFGSPRAGGSQEGRVCVVAALTPVFVLSTFSGVQFAILILPVVLTEAWNKEKLWSGII